MGGAVAEAKSHRRIVLSQLPLAISFAFFLKNKELNG